MQQNKSSKKSIIIIIVIILITLGIYFYMNGSPTDTSSSLEATSSGPAPSGDSLEVLSLLNKVNTIKIDPAFFETNVFKSLLDHTVIVPEQNVGKPNPFLVTFGATPATPAKK